jgi:hypothetical protein
VGEALEWEDFESFDASSCHVLRELVSIVVVFKMFCVFPWFFFVLCVSVFLFFSVFFFQCASMATTVCSVYGADRLI